MSNSTGYSYINTIFNSRLVTVIPTRAAVMRHVWNKKNEPQVIRDTRNGVFYGITAKGNSAIVDTGDAKN
ncbi:hypothetical protein PG987_006016 [Apiospora arundinis]